jgi:hypothetical protein
MIGDCDFRDGIAGCAGTPTNWEGIDKHWIMLHPAYDEGVRYYWKFELKPNKAMEADFWFCAECHNEAMFYKLMKQLKGEPQC